MRHAFVLILITAAGVTLCPSQEKPARPANRLAKESSPYLRQHAHNPVDWYPWGPEAFEKAKKEGKLVFLSIGYSSCHWCHVMERESFENKDVAKLMNDSFVCIKVDREERPDIDEIYMASLHVLGQPGGWPLSMFLTAAGKPIAGGTYWPPEDRQISGETAKGFKSVLKLILQINKERPKEVAEQADKVAELTNERLSRALSGVAIVELDQKIVNETVSLLMDEFDELHGGFGNKARAFRGPKFPVPCYLQLLQQVARQKKTVGIAGNLEMTLDHMARGGIFDHLGGGFHRYSTERTWTVPHFEKMLYDNAQLAEIFADATGGDPKSTHARTLRATLDFILRELTAPEHGFYSALDADSEGEEGRFYVWKASELEKALPDKAEREIASALYGADRGVNFEDKYSILTLPQTLAEFAKKREMTPEQLDAKVNAVRQKLVDVRAKRPRPFLDTKILTAWNGQMIAGFAAAGKALNEPKYTVAGVKAADFILKNLRTKDGRLLRTWSAEPGKPGGAKLNGYLDDYAFLVHGLLALHDATGDKRWLDEAKMLTDLMIRWHWDEKNGGFFYTSHDHEKLFARSKDQYDGAQPSGNSVATRNLVRLWQRTKDDKYKSLAKKQFEAFAGNLKSNPTALTTMVLALAEFLDGGGFAKPGPHLGGKGDSNKAIKSDSVVQVTAKAPQPDADGKQVVTVTMEVNDGWHIYANPVGNEMLDSAKTVITAAGKGNPKVLSVEYPKAKKVEDKLAGDYLVYEGKIAIKLTIQRAAGDKEPLDMTAKFMACAEGKDGKPGKCLLPATVKAQIP